MRARKGQIEGRPEGSGDEPLRYNKQTARRWRGRLEPLDDGACCICRRRPPITDRVFDRMWAAIFSGGEPVAEETLSMLWVDHDHATRSVRGMICSDCNAAIFPFEFNRPMDEVRRRYLAEGDRLQRAERHMTHVVLKTADHGLRLVSRDSDAMTRRMAAGSTAAEIRATVWDAIAKVRRGEMTAADLNALSRDAGATLAVVRAQLRAARVMRRVDETSRGSDRLP